MYTCNQKNNNEMPESSGNLEIQSETVNDLGALLLPSKSNAEITGTMSKLSNSQKYSLQ